MGGVWVEDLETGECADGRIGRCPGGQAGNPPPFYGALPDLFAWRMPGEAAISGGERIGNMGASALRFSAFFPLTVWYFVCMTQLRWVVPSVLGGWSRHGGSRMPGPSGCAFGILRGGCPFLGAEAGVFT